MSTSAFRDLGRVANAAETRTCVLNKGTDGDFYFINCARGFLVSTNLRTKESGFYPFPDGYMGWPFGSYGAKTGKVYVGAGQMFFEFDPAGKAYTFAAKPHPNMGISCDAWTFTEADDGMIYFGACPKTYLTGFDPKTRTFIDYGIQDENQQYLASVAVDNAGWVYCGIGTAKRVITAVNLATKEKRVLGVNDEAGAACVCNAFDGSVYGTYKGDTLLFPYDPGRKWFRLYGGEICEDMTEAFDNGYSSVNGGADFNAIHCPYEEHPTILHQDLVDHDLRYIHPDTGEEVCVTLPYEVPGAELSPITEMPDGKICGTTNHPFQFFTYDPKTDAICNYGKKQVVPLGNICTYAAQGDILAGMAYASGSVMRIDMTKPLCADYDANPHREGSFSEILRPRSAAALPDGRRVVFGGYNAYGKTGGGLLVYDTVDRSCHLIENEKLLHGESVMTMVVLSETLLLCGTCIAAPGGGQVTAKEASLFLFDLKEEKVLWSMSPFAGVPTIAHMKMGADGLIHGVTVNAIHFVFDTEKRAVVFTEDLSEHGGVPRDGMKVDADGTIWGLLHKAIYRIKPGAQNAEIVTAAPTVISAGMALIDNKIYFGSGSHLWEYTIQ